jgi:hypothetical protein
VVFRRIFPAGYERTCEACGYVWQLNRRQARFHARPPSAGPKTNLGWPSGRPTFAEQLELSDKFTHCAACGSRTFSQRPLTDYRRPQ